MVRPVKRQFMRMGPTPIPTVPIAQFEKRGGKEFNQQLEELWSIIGPSVELNLKRLPLWKVITMAYFEGGVHAIQMMEDEDN